MCDALASRGVDATVVDNEIHVTISSGTCDAWRAYHADRIARWRTARRGFVGPHAAIRHLPDRFLRNLELHLDVFAVPLTEPQLKLIEHSIREFGAVSLDSNEVEFGIAYRHCTDHQSIDGLRTEIERLKQWKDALVEDQEFAAAAGARDREYEVRSQLDTLLFHAR